MSLNPKIVIIGATSAIATAVARIWVARSPVDLVLLGRDKQRLDRVAADLRVRSPLSEIRVLVVPGMTPSLITTTVDALASEGVIDRVLIAQGSLLPSQDACQDSLEACDALLQVNGITPVLYAEAFANHMAGWNHGHLGLIGSVAGDRGRASNYVYGAAKGLLAHYVEGLQHRFAKTAVRVTLIKPGPTDTPMTAVFKAQGRHLASVESVAGDIVDAIAAGDAVCYTPKRWRWIMMVVRSLPNTVFHHLRI